MFEETENYGLMLGLIGKLVDGGMDDADVVLLNAIMLSDDEACEFYVKNMAAHSLLIWRSHVEINEVGDVDACYEVEEYLEAEDGRELVGDRVDEVEVSAAEDNGVMFGFGGITVYRNRGESGGGLGRGAKALIAAILLVGVMLGIVMQGEDGENDLAGERVVAGEMIRGEGVVWGGAGKGGLFYMGDEFELKKGFVEIRMGNGAGVLVEGPSRFVLRAGNYFELVEGRVVARCDTKGSRGFVIAAGSGEVVDYGTAFGVEHKDGGVMEVVLFEGRVGVTGMDGDGIEGEEKRLGAGEICIVGGDGVVGATGMIGVDVGRRYFRDWVDVKSRPGVSGEIEWVGVGAESYDLNAFESDAFIRLSVERVGVLLEEDLKVGIVDGGVHKPLEVVARFLGKGLRVDSYLLHLDRPGVVDGSDIKRYKGRIKFDRKIVGIITASGQLNGSDQLFGHKGSVYYGGVPRGLNNETPDHVDVIEISEDGRVLFIDLAVANFDELRILVASKEVKK